MKDKNKLTQKQKAVALDIFNDINPGQAYMNHYNCKNLAVAGACANRLLKTAKFQGYLAELQEATRDKTVADVRERKQRLTVIARENNVSAKGTLLRGPNIMAIAELNKMEHIYEQRPNYNDNRTYNILVQGDETRDRFTKLLEGKRPQIEEGE